MGQLATKSEKVQQVEHLLKNLRPGIRDALPAHMTPDRVLRIALTSIRKVPKLLECTPESLCACLLTCTQRGLAPDSSSQHAHLIPFKDKNTGTTVCTLIFGFKGLMDLALRHKDVLSFHVPQAVYEQDAKEYELGLEPKLVHKPAASADRGKIVAFYAVARLANGEKPFVWMWLHEVEKVRDAVYQWQKKPWKDHFEAMGLKTVVRRLCKWLPATPDLERALRMDGQADAGVEQELDVSFVDVAGTSAPSGPKSLEDMVPNQPEPKRRGRPKKDPEPAEQPTAEQEASPSDDQPHDPELLRKGIAATWQDMPPTRYPDALKAAGLEKYSDINTLTDAKRLREIYDCFLEFLVPADV